MVVDQIIVTLHVSTSGYSTIFWCSNPLCLLFLATERWFWLIRKELLYQILAKYPITSLKDEPIFIIFQIAEMNSL